MAPSSTRIERQMLIRSDEFVSLLFSKKLDEGVHRNDSEMEMAN